MNFKILFCLSFAMNLFGMEDSTKFKSMPLTPEVKKMCLDVLEDLTAGKYTVQKLIHPDLDDRSFGKIYEVCFEQDKKVYRVYCPAFFSNEQATAFVISYRQKQDTQSSFGEGFRKTKIFGAFASKK